VTWIPTPEAHENTNVRKGSLTQTGAALVTIGVTALTFATGGTAAGVLGITNGVGAASINAGATSLGTQLAINTINSDGDVGKALGDVSLKQVATSAATAGITQGLINAVSPAVITRVDQNIQAGAGASTKATDLGITQSGSMTQAAGFGDRSLTAAGERLSQWQDRSGDPQGSARRCGVWHGGSCGWLLRRWSRWRRCG
jgi:hypothetical protein